MPAHLHSSDKTNKKKKTGSTGNQQTDCLDETADRRKCFYLMTFLKQLLFKL